MPSFFSGTDTATLKEEGTDRNNFVSLIVNNAGSYTAAITRKIKSKSIKESISYEFFGEGKKYDTEEYRSEENEIEWFYLNIEKEENPFSFQDMDDRFEEIRKKKAEEAKKAELDKKQAFQTASYKPAIDINSYGIGAKSPNGISNKKTFIQTSLFDDMEDVNDWNFDDFDIPYGTVRFNKNTIRQLTLQLITGSIIISDDSKIDMEKWAESMPAIYQKRFGKGEEGMKLFEFWADAYTEFLTWYTTDNKLKAQGIDETEMCAICAHDIIEELNKLPENEYIKGYIEALQKYLIV